MNEQISKVIEENYQRVNERIERAALSAGRAADEITLVGVTKYVDHQVAKTLYDAGCVNLGESRPQVLDEKASQLEACNIKWHMIGHLQRNKVAKTLRYASMIHSVDSLRLAQSIDRIAGEQGLLPEVLLEINVSGEVAKHGFRLDGIEEIVSNVLHLGHLRLRGLMCMAGLKSNVVETASEFQQLRLLLESLRNSFPSLKEFTELSMGMSSDFEVAIAQGATIVRVGSILYEGLR